MQRFNGVATKYLDHYLGWQRSLAQFKNLTHEQLLFSSVGTYQHLRKHSLNYLEFKAKKIPNMFRYSGLSYIFKSILLNYFIKTDLSTITKNKQPKRLL